MELLTLIENRHEAEVDVGHVIRQTMKFFKEIDGVDDSRGKSVSEARAIFDENLRTDLQVALNGGNVTDENQPNASNVSHTQG